MATSKMAEGFSVNRLTITCILLVPNVIGCLIYDRVTQNAQDSAKQIDL